VKNKPFACTFLSGISRKGCAAWVPGHDERGTRKLDLRGGKSWRYARALHAHWLYKKLYLRVSSSSFVASTVSTGTSSGKSATAAADSTQVLSTTRGGSPTAV
jgi:hypothetical protein